MSKQEPPGGNTSQPASPSSVLLIKPGSLGDVVHALPVASALHAAWPSAKLAWVIDPRWRPILEGNPAIDEIVPFPREQFRGLKNLPRAITWYTGQRHRRPDIAVDLQGLLRSALVARCSCSRRTVGLSDAREGSVGFYHQYAKVKATQHAVDRYLSVLKVLEIPLPARLEFPLPTGDSIAQPLPEDFLLLHPFARGAGKSLDAEAIRGLCERLGPTPVVLAGMGDSPAELPGNVIDLARKTTLSQLIGLIRRARKVISVDSGPMHIAAAVGVPLLSIHTWSDPRRVGPYSSSAMIWQGGELRAQSLSAPLLPEKPLTLRDLDSIAAWALAEGIADSGI
jgi:ADP-heptose:LPS heptosyltransferase